MPQIERFRPVPYGVRKDPRQAAWQESSSGI
jgi:hypothetical protein